MLLYGLYKYLKKVISEMTRFVTRRRLIFVFIFKCNLLSNASVKFVKDLPSCNNIKIELINRLILKRKEIHADQNNLCR